MVDFKIGIVLYNPDSNSVNRIINLANQGFQFCLFDNSSKTNNILIEVNNVEYFTFNDNLGLAFSIDYLCRHCINSNFSKLLFFDQDTIFTRDTLDFIEDVCKEIIALDSMFFNDVVSINFRESGTKHVKLNTFDYFDVGSFSFSSNYFVINSGSLYFLDKYFYFKWFDKNYFVDGVDYSFSLNVLINNFKNISIINTPGLNHTDFQGDSTISFFGRKIISRIYPLRRNFDFFYSHSKLLIKSLRVNSFFPLFFLVRAIIGYFFTQFLFRFRYMFFN